MINFYKTISKSTLKAVALGLMLTGSGWVKAQLSGTYTLNSGSATGGTNYNNWADFATAINTVGVSGPVTLNVQSSLTVTATVQFNQFTGTSSTNRVTINGGANVITYAGITGAPEVFLFNGADNITINNLVIRNSGTVVDVMGVRFTSNANNNVINGCTIEFNSLTGFGTSAGGAYVAFANTTSLSQFGGGLAAGNGADNVIIGNLMRTTNTNSPGPFCGIFETQSTSNYTSTAYNNTFRNNTIQNFYTYGIHSAYTNGTTIANNDISRANVTSGLPRADIYPLYQWYTNSTNRRIRCDSNKIHDLPFVNATVSTAHTNTWNISLALTVGTSTLPMSVRGNEIYNVFTNTGGNMGIFGQSVSFCDIRQNRIENIRNNSTGTGLTNGSLVGIYFTGGSALNVIGNNILRNRPFQDFYGIYMANQSTAVTTEISQNTLKDNQSISTNYSFFYTYGIYANNGSWNVYRNMIDELIQQGPYGYCIPFYANVTGATHNWYSNIATHCIGGYYTWGLYSNVNSGATLNFRQNTMNFNYSVSPWGWSYYQWFHYGFGTGVTNYVGNIMLSNTSYYWGMYYGSTTTNCTYAQNHFWVPSSSWGAYFYSPVSNTVYDYPSWVSAGFGGQVGDMRRDPRFFNVSGSNRDFRCRDFMTQNNVPTLAVNPVEFNGNARNPIMSDRGASENFMDITRVRSNLNVPAVVCSGWEQDVFMTVRNLFADTAYNFNVSYSANNGPKTTRRVTAKLRQNDTSKVDFTVPIRLNRAGLTRVAVYIDIPDDNRANDSFVFVTLVKPAPGGGRYTQSTTPTNAFYQLGRAFDVTQINVPVYYRVNAPRVYSNSTYWNGSGSSAGKDWTASVSAITKGGKVLVSGSSINQHPSGSNDLEVKFETANASLEDSSIILITKISDLNNQCDTFIRREILIYPTIVPDFKIPAKICDGEDVLFEQKSTVRSGGIEFFWNFGTGVAADTSNAPEPVFRFPAPGTYTVKMTGRTLPYYFPSSISKNVVVGPIPSTKFAKVNACEGQDVVFTNQTTPSSGVLNTWNFGDGNTKVDGNTTVLHKYNTAGAYTVTLTANLNGCIGTATQRVYQFPKPKAAYTQVSGKCDNETFSFTNGSTIKTGSWGPIWSFGDGGVSTEDNPTYKFSNSGNMSVKLLTTSEFGCKDSVIKTIDVLESPKVSFVNNAACSRTATSFTNTTPSVGGPGGVVNKYSWSFGDGGTSLAENPSHNWSSLGPKTVNFAIDLANGCKANISKELTVGIQPKAAFTVGDICLGKPAIFVNNTTWPQGDISYVWNFGDGNTSTSTSPIHSYNKAFSPNVTLYATIAGGCTDSVVINTFNVIEGPRTCDFSTNTDYAFGFYGIKLEPLNESNGIVGGQANVDYTWIFQGGGTNSSTGVNAATSYDFQSDGSYTVTMRARSKSAPFCECSKTKQVVMNRTEVKSFEETGVAIFPNPNNGQFTIALKENFGSQVTVEITNIAGGVVKTLTADNSGSISVNTGDVADGTYLVRVRSGNRTAVRRITVRR
jgi:PKD repeat protein